MAVPTKDEFKSYINLINNFDAMELFHEVVSIFPTNESPANFGKKNNDAPPCFEKTYTVQKKVDELLNSKSKLLRTHPVDKWLFNQRAFLLAHAASSLKGEEGMGSINGNVNDESRKFIANFAEVSLVDIESKFEQSVGSELDLSSLRVVMLKLNIDKEIFDPSTPVSGDKYESILIRAYVKTELQNPFRILWLKCVAHSLANYFYSDINPSSEAEQIAKTRAVTHKTINALEELSAHFHKISKKESLRLAAYKELSRIDKLIVKIQNIHAINEGRVIPVKRKDTSAKERLLAYHLWKGGVNPVDYGQACKATAITHLLSIEGVENPIQQRSIEKLIQGWKSESTTISELR